MAREGMDFVDALEELRKMKRALEGELRKNPGGQWEISVKRQIEALTVAVQAIQRTG